MNTSIPLSFQDINGTPVRNTVLGIVERISSGGMEWLRSGGIIHRTEKRKGVFVSIGVKLVEDEDWIMPRLVECDWETPDSEKPEELAVPETSTREAAEDIVAEVGIQLAKGITNKSDSDALDE